MKTSTSVQVNYQFAAEPKTVKSRAKYRDTNEIRFLLFQTSTLLNVYF